MGLKTVIPQKGAKGLDAGGQAVFGHPVVVQVAAAEVALQGPRVGLPEIDLQENDDGSGVGQDVFRVRAGYQVQPRLEGPLVPFPAFSQNRTLFRKGVGGSEADVGEAAFMGFFYDLIFGDHRLFFKYP